MPVAAADIIEIAHAHLPTFQGYLDSEGIHVALDEITNDVEIVWTFYIPRKKLFGKDERKDKLVEVLIIWKKPYDPISIFLSIYDLHGELTDNPRLTPVIKELLANAARQMGAEIALAMDVPWRETNFHLEKRR